MKGLFATFGPAQPVVSGNQTAQQIIRAIMDTDLKESSS